VRPFSLAGDEVTKSAARHVPQAYVDALKSPADNAVGDRMHRYELDPRGCQWRGLRCDEQAAADESGGSGFGLAGRANPSSRKRFQGVGRQNLQRSWGRLHKRRRDVTPVGESFRNSASVPYVGDPRFRGHAIPGADSVVSSLSGAISGRFRRTGRSARERNARPPCRDNAPPVERAGRERGRRSEVRRGPAFGSILS
jgi:hypothetical protein